MKRLSIFIVLIFVGLSSNAQKIDTLNFEKSKISFRGLSSINDSIVWIGGTEGTIGVSADYGKTFQWVNPKGYEDRDFRAVAAVDSQTAIAVAIASPAVILRTTDRGKSWRAVYKDEHPDVFLDAIDFSGTVRYYGIIVGDPVDGEPYILETRNSGNTWTKINKEDILGFDFKKGEAFFAASNSNVKVFGLNQFMAVSGGVKSNLFHKKRTSFGRQLIYSPKEETEGPNAFDFWVTENYGLIAGGDFMNPESSENNLIIFRYTAPDFIEFTSPTTPPEGYRSGVTILDDNRAITCGPAGVDFSSDQGDNWERISEISFHSCKRSKLGKAVYLTGPIGIIGVFRE